MGETGCDTWGKRGLSCLELAPRESHVQAELVMEPGKLELGLFGGIEEATAREAAERHAVLLGESVREPSGDRKVPVVAAEPRISRRSDHLD